MFQKRDSWFKHSIVLNGLSYGIANLFDFFVPRRSMNEGTTSIADPLIIFFWCTVGLKRRQKLQQFIPFQSYHVLEKDNHWINNKPVFLNCLKKTISVIKNPLQLWWNCKLSNTLQIFLVPVIIIHFRITKLHKTFFLMGGEGEGEHCKVGTPAIQKHLTWTYVVSLHHVLLHLMTEALPLWNLPYCHGNLSLMHCGMIEIEGQTILPLLQLGQLYFYRMLQHLDEQITP